MYKLYIGNETHISLDKAKQLVKKLRDETTSEYISLDVEKYKANELIDILSSNSLFSTTRVIFLKRIYRNKEKDSIIEFLLTYLQQESNNHIVIWEDQKVSAATRYVKFFKSTTY